LVEKAAGVDAFGCGSNPGCVFDEGGEKFVAEAVPGERRE
jgi:hypothetical protein